jgi:hypothetical protein
MCYFATSENRKRKRNPMPMKGAREGRFIRFLRTVMALGGSTAKPLAFAAFYPWHGKNGVGREHTLGGDRSPGLPTMLLAQGAKCRGSGQSPGDWAGRNLQAPKDQMSQSAGAAGPCSGLSWGWFGAMAGSDVGAGDLDGLVQAGGRVGDLSHCKQRNNAATGKSLTHVPVRWPKNCLTAANEKYIVKR